MMLDKVLVEVYYTMYNVFKIVSDYKDTKLERENTGVN